MLGVGCTSKLSISTTRDVQTHSSPTAVAHTFPGFAIHNDGDTMLRTLVRRAAQQTEQTAAASQPQKRTSEYVQRMIALYPRKKVWPPDFRRLSPEERLGFEKRYKRRMALATASPRWVKFTKIAQLFSIVCRLSPIIMEARIMTQMY